MIQNHVFHRFARTHFDPWEANVVVEFMNVSTGGMMILPFHEVPQEELAEIEYQNAAEMRVARIIWRALTMGRSAQESNLIDAAALVAILSDLPVDSHTMSKKLLGALENKLVSDIAYQGCAQAEKPSTDLHVFEIRLRNEHSFQTYYFTPAALTEISSNILANPDKFPKNSLARSLVVNNPDILTVGKQVKSQASTFNMV